MVVVFFWSSLSKLAFVFVLQRSARAAAENSDAVFTELIRAIELKRFEVRELIKAQEKKAADEAKQLLEKMQKEIAELKTGEAELSRLASVEDSVQFLQVGSLLCSARLQVSSEPGALPLQGCRALPAPPVPSAPPPIAASPRLTFDPAMAALTDFKKLLQEVCQDGFVSIYQKGE